MPCRRSVDHGPTVRTTTPFASIARIHSLFDEWRTLGSRRLSCGTELIGPMGDDDAEAWLHILYPGLHVSEVNDLEQRIGHKLPRELRAFYRRTAGMVLWSGAFRVYGFRPPGIETLEDNRFPDDILALNHQLDVLGWKPPGALAFAENGWDMSVHVVGMNDNPSVVCRCDRRTGNVLETHPSVWVCFATRLNKIDGLVSH